MIRPSRQELAGVVGPWCGRCNHTPRCIAGLGIVLQQEQAYLFKGLRGPLQKHSAQGLVRTVVVTEAQTGERVILRLASTSLMASFAQDQLHPGEPNDVRYCWAAPDHGHRPWLVIKPKMAHPA